MLIFYFDIYFRFWICILTLFIYWWCICLFVFFAILGCLFDWLTIDFFFLAFAVRSWTCIVCWTFCFIKCIVDTHSILGAAYLWLHSCAYDCTADHIAVTSVGLLLQQEDIVFILRCFIFLYILGIRCDLTPRIFAFWQNTSISHLWWLLRARLSLSCCAHDFCLLFFFLC